MKDIKNIQIAYIGGGSRAWAHNLMNDLAKDEEIGGTVRLYDIDMEGARLNEKIGNDLSAREDIKGKWVYKACETIGEALSGDYEKAFVAFLNNPNMCLSEEKARELFDRMLENTKAYLPYYDTYVERRKA